LAIETEIDHETIGIMDSTESTGVLKTVYDTIKFQRNGISRAEIIKLTGFKEKQVSNCLYKLSKKNMIKSEKRGIWEVADKREYTSRIQRPARKSKQRIGVGPR